MPTETAYLLVGYFNGTLDAEQLAELERWVAADPANADTLARYAIEQRAMEHMLRMDRVGDLSDLSASDFELPDPEPASSGDTTRALSELARLEAQAGAADPVDLTDELARRKRIAKQKARIASLRSRPHGTAQSNPLVIPRALIWMGIAAALVCAASVIYKITPQTQPASNPAYTQRPGDPPLRHVQVASVTDALDARWHDGRPVTPGEAIYDQAYMLATGIIQLELTSGVTLTIEGPARVSLGSDMLVSLESGTLVGHVPRRAQGFTVRTDSVDVVDLGTEFAVEVISTNGADRVQVLDGTVLLQPNDTDRRFQPTVANAGDALQVSAEGFLETVEVEPNRYYRWVPTAYERMIRRARPHVYWRFDGLNAVGHVSGLGRFSVTLTGLDLADLSAEPIPATGEALSLWLRDARRSIQTVDPIDLDLQGGLTIEAWVWVPSDTDRRMRIISNNRLSEGRRHTGGVGFGVSGLAEDRMLGGPVLHFTGYAAFDAYSSTPVPTDRWTHVTASLDTDGGFRMTIDGRPVSHRVRRYNHLSRVPGNRAGALHVLPGNDIWLVAASNNQSVARHEHWVGGIDELAIYSRVLSVEEIAEHSALD